MYVLHLTLRTLCESNEAWSHLTFIGSIIETKGISARTWCSNGPVKRRFYLIFPSIGAMNSLSIDSFLADVVTNFGASLDIRWRDTYSTISFRDYAYGCCARWPHRVASTALRRHFIGLIQLSHSR